MYDAIHKTLGSVPNIFQGMASSPAVLEAYLNASEALKKGSLTFAERETVALAVSQFNSCQYCLAAHTALGNMAGLAPEGILKIRRFRSDDPKTTALLGFVQAVLKKTGNITAEDIQDVKEAGYDDARLTEVLMVIGLTVFTNLFNHVNQTTVDFPAAQTL
jgi:uncharacterized peroxidase-related enzyme